MARDPKRIDRMLELVRLVWKEYPDLRLAQLVHNAARDGGWRAYTAYQCEDDLVEEGLICGVEDVLDKRLREVLDYYACDLVGRVSVTPSLVLSIAVRRRGSDKTYVGIATGPKYLGTAARSVVRRLLANEVNDGT